MTQTKKIVAALGIAGVILVACGSRVAPLPQAQGPGGVTNPDGGIVGPDGSLLDPSGNPIDPGGLGGGGTTNGPGSLPGTGSGGSAGPIATKCSGTSNANPAQGFTKTEIKIGQVVAIGGPLPGQFTDAVDAAEAYVASVNAAGGICGRTIKLLTRDDGGDGATNEAKARELADVDKVFAFVGSASAPSDEGIGKVAEEKKIPDIGFPLSFARGERAYTFGVPGSVQKDALGTGAAGSGYLNKRFGIRQVAIMWVVEAEVSPLSAWGFEAAMLKSTRHDSDPNNDITICFEAGTTVFTTSFKPFVANIKTACPEANGPLAVYSVMENNANIRFANAMQSEGLWHKFFTPTWASYGRSFINEAATLNGRKSTEGSFMALYGLPAQRCPVDSRGKFVAKCGHAELNSYIAALNKYKPRGNPGAFGGAVWAQFELLRAGLQSCGNNLSRSCFMKFIRTTGPFSAGGLVTGTRPSDQIIYTCDLLVEVKNSRYTEVPAPAGKKGPSHAPAFWNCSDLFNWWEYYCDNKEKFPPNPDRERTVQCS